MSSDDLGDGYGEYAGPDRAETSEQTFDAAAWLAKVNDMRLTNPSDGCFQLRHLTFGWIINMYPRRGGAHPRMYHDPNHKGPFLKLPEDWTLLQAVQSALVAADQQKAKATT